MKWAGKIKADSYNIDKIAATKANLTEVSTLINNRVQFINRTRGRLTLEEQELLLIKDKVDNRLADVQFILDVATVKRLLREKRMKCTKLMLQMVMKLKPVL